LSNSFRSIALKGINRSGSSFTSILSRTPTMIGLFLRK
jgi:hypothetical protein